MERAYYKNLTSVPKSQKAESQIFLKVDKAQ